MAELRQIASKLMTENMKDMEEKSVEFGQVTRHKMSDIEEKSAEMAREMRRNPLHESTNEKGEGG